MRKIMFLVAAALLSVPIITFAATTTKTTVKKKVVAPKVETLKNGAVSERKTVKTANGSFTVDLVTIDTTKGISVISETAEKSNCANNCSAKALADYVKAVKGFAGIHGAYFCPPDYKDCINKKNTFGAPFYSSANKTLRNSSKVTNHQSSLMVFDTSGKATFFVRGQGFSSVGDFERTSGTTVSAIVGNYPALMHSGQNIVTSEPMDEKQRTAKGDRGGIGIAGNKIFLVIAHSATVPDLAAVMQSLGATEALNLDGGATSALYFNGKYKVGPGRLLPSAVIFK